MDTLKINRPRIIRNEKLVFLLRFICYLAYFVQKKTNGNVPDTLM